MVQPCGLGRHAVRGQNHVVSESADLHRAEGHVRDDLVADRQVAHPVPNGIDHARGVAAQDEWVSVLQHRLEPTGGDVVVERVQARSMHPEQDFARPGCRGGELGQDRLLAGGRNVDCAHQGLLMTYG